MKEFIRLDEKIWIIIGSVFLIVISFFYYQRTFSERFVDEEENFVFGKQIIKGDKIYKDLFSVHQPIPYLISGSLQYTTTPNSIYSLVKSHRQFMILYSLFWGILMLYFFGKQILYCLIPFELGKVYLFGHLFLAEGLAVSPLILLLSILFLKKTLIEKNSVLILTGLLISYCGLILAPVWPLLGVLSAYIIYKNFRYPFKIIVFCSMLFLPVLFILPFISVNDYFDQIFRINSQYNIPFQVSESIFLRSIKAFLSPFLVFVPVFGWSISLMFMQLMSIILLFSSVFVLKNLRTLTIIFILLGLGNIRFYYPGLEGYEGFHLLPWFGLICFFSTFLLFEAWRKYEKKKFANYILIGVLILIISVSSYYTKIFQPEDQQKSYYVNYSRQIDTGEILNILGDRNDKYFIGSDDSLSYWQTNVTHANRFISVHPWILASSELREEIDNLFVLNPPTFVYVPDEKFNDYVQLNNYSELSRYGAGSKIFVLNSKRDTFTNDEIMRVKFWGVSLD